MSKRCSRIQTTDKRGDLRNHTQTREGVGTKLSPKKQLPKDQLRGNLPKNNKGFTKIRQAPRQEL